MVIEPVTPTNNSLAQGVAAENDEHSPETPATPDLGVSAEFSGLFHALLGKSDQEQVNEEELYSAIIERRLEELSPEAAEKYRTAKTTQLGNFTREDGYTYVEKASLAALIDTVDSGLITEEQGRQVNGEAFTAAQLDDDHGLLYDGRGTTNATSQMSQALFELEQMLTKIAAGEMTIEGKDLVDPQAGSFVVSTERTSGSGESDGSETSEEESSTEVTDEVGSSSGGNSIKDRDEDDDAGVFGKGLDRFTWKPISDKDGKVAVLLPTMLIDVIESVQVKDSDGKVKDTAKSDGKTEHGERPIYRFSDSGSDYGKAVSVTVNKTDGTSVSFDVDDGSNESSAKA